ncbi:hypothetical protein ML8HA_01949 [Lactococcus lactis]|nr:hypothetical protein [Lactococcus lactis]
MKKYWVVEDHLGGGFYLMPEDTPEEELREVEVYCDTCGDNDFYYWSVFKLEST